MIDAVILHSANEAEAARRLAAAWPGQRAAVAEIAADGRNMTFGRQVLICAIWTGAANGVVDGVAMAAALAAARRRGVVLRWRDQTPPDAILNAGAPIIEAEDGADRDGARLLAIARDIDVGRFLTVAAPAAQAASPSASKLKKRATPTELATPVRRTAEAAIDAPDMRGRRMRKQLIGFAVGVGLGAALFFGFAAPRLSAWIGAAQTDRPPPSLLHAAVVAPPSRQAPPTPIAAPPPAQASAPPAPIVTTPIAATPPLRGLTDPNAAQKSETLAPATAQTTAP